MDSPAVRLTASLGMLGLVYWCTFAPKAAASRATDVVPENIETLAASSNALCQAGRYSDALAPTEALVARYPTQHVYLQRLATIYQHLGRRREEAAVWHRFIDVSPTPWEACPTVAEAHAAADDPAGALAAAETCWKLAPWDADAAFFLGRARERTADRAAAAVMYRRALDLDAAHFDSELGLARLDLQANRLDAARATALDVSKRDPKHADAALILGLVAQRQGNKAGAREYFNRTLTLAEGSFDAHVGLGIIEFGDTNLEASRKHFEKAAELDASRRAEIAVWLERTHATR